MLFIPVKNDYIEGQICTAMKDKGVVTLRKFSTSGEASIYASLLEGAGINVMLVGEYVNDIYPIGDSWAGIELRVAPEDEKQAREILSAKFDKDEFKTESAKKSDPEK